MYEMCRINKFILFALVTVPSIITWWSPFLRCRLFIVISFDQLFLTCAESGIFESSFGSLRGAYIELNSPNREHTKMVPKTIGSTTLWHPKSIFSHWNRSMPLNYVTSTL